MTARGTQTLTPTQAGMAGKELAPPLKSSQPDAPGYEAGGNGTGHRAVRLTIACLRQPIVTRV